MTPMRIVYVRWNDAGFQDDSVRLPDFDEECVIEEVGILARETDTHISIAMDYNPADESYRNVAHIPKVLIRQIRIVDNIMGMCLYEAGMRPLPTLAEMQGILKEGCADEQTTDEVRPALAAQEN